MVFFSRSGFTGPFQVIYGVKNADTKGRGRAFKIGFNDVSGDRGFGTVPYHGTGLWATFLFMSLRLGQSILCGADLPCSIVFVAAYSPSHKSQLLWCGGDDGSIGWPLLLVFVMA